MCKIFADDTSIFSKVLDVNKSVIELNVDLEKTNELIKGKCNLTLSPINKQVKLFFLFIIFHITYFILPLNLMKESLPNAIIRTFRNNSRLKSQL